MNIRYFIKMMMDKIWRFDVDDIFLELLFSKKIKRFKKIKKKFQDTSVNKTFSILNDQYEEKEFVFKSKVRSLLCPYTGQIIVGLRMLLQHNSLSEPVYYPSFFKRIKNLKSNNRIVKAIVLDSKGYGENYFHFFMDIISRVHMINRLSYLDEIPLIVAERTYRTHFFKFFMDNSDLFKRRKIIFLKKNSDWLSVDELYIVRSYIYERESILKTVEETKSLQKEITRNNVYEKIFISRSSEHERYLSNRHEVEAFLQTKGFYIIEPKDYSFQEQVTIFSQSKFIIGLHGAGMTNLIFAQKNSPKILELAQKDRIAAFYYFLSKTLNCDYNILLGSEAKLDNDLKTNFSIDINKLEKAVIELLGC